MKLARLIPLLLPILSYTTHAQNRPLKKIVVSDIETRVPLRNAIVTTTDGYCDTTNYRGICRIPMSFDTLTISKPNYLTERMLPGEVKDSTFLLPDHKRIGEVTVWGKDRNTRMQENINQWILHDEVISSTPNAGGFDVARMLDRRRHKDKSHLKKTRKMFNKMEKHDEDPIVNAYKAELEKRRIAAERAKKTEEKNAAPK